MPLKRIGKVNIGTKKIVVYFEDGEELEMNKEVYLDYPLYKGKEVDEKTIKEIKRRNKEQKLYDYAFKYVTTKLTSEANLIQKLENRGASKKEISDIVKKLSSAAIFDEKRHFLDQVELLDHANYGENRIKDQLYKKGYKDEWIRELKFDESREKEKLNNQLPKIVKKYSKKYSYNKMKEHVYANLIRLGFSSDLAYTSLSHIKFDAENQDNSLSKAFNTAINKYKDKYLGKMLEVKVLNYLLEKGYRPSEIKKIVKENENVFI